MLRLKPEGSADFFQVLTEDGRHAGRIFKSNSAPAETPWFWTIEWFSRRGTGPHQGYGATPEAAMMAFRRAWDSSPVI
jgi:hypothetical protein